MAFCFEVIARGIIWLGYRTALFLGYYAQPSFGNINIRSRGANSPSTYKKTYRNI